MTEPSETLLPHRRSVTSVVDVRQQTSQTVRGKAPSRPPGAERTASILHADLDSFYASVALLSRPELRGKPVIVGSGVVLSATYEAKRCGVVSGSATPAALRLCPHAIVVDGDFREYSRLSDEVFAVMARFTPNVEPISIDEAFLDVAGVRRILGSPVEIATRLRAEVLAETGLVVSVGVARTKFLAKVASRASKPDGLLVVEPDEELDFLHPLPVEAVWGIGPATAEKLNLRGVRTVGELARVPDASLRAWLGPHGARQLRALAWNTDPRKVTPTRRARSVGAQSTFGRDVRDPETYRVVLGKLADRVATRLRAKDRAGRTITVRIRFADWTTITRARTLGAPTDATAAIFHVAEELLMTELERPEDPGEPARPGLRLLGISLSQLGPPLPYQMELPLGTGRGGWARPGSVVDSRARRLDQALDRARTRFGRHFVSTAAAMRRPDGSYDDLGGMLAGFVDRRPEDDDDGRAGRPSLAPASDPDDDPDPVEAADDW
jgi:DNA polymerase IV